MDTSIVNPPMTALVTGKTHTTLVAKFILDQAQLAGVVDSLGGMPIFLE
jgi:hypothetical protein